MQLYGGVIMADYQRQVNTQVTLTADDTSLTSHKWFINGQQVSTAASIIWKPTEAGLYTIRHEGSSNCGNCTPVEKTVEVTAEAPVIKYRCTGSPDYKCVEDPAGTHDSLSACQSACKAAAAEAKTPTGLIAIGTLFAIGAAYLVIMRKKK